jgi:type III secretion protein S
VIEDSQILAKAFQVIALATAPVLLTAMLTGILVGLVQTVVQVQDQTVSYVIKLAAVCVTLLATAAWMMRQLKALFDLILDAVPLVSAVSA